MACKADIILKVLAESTHLVKLVYLYATLSRMKHKYPLTLKVFFATELWERYGFYTVQALLALYLLLRFHYSDDHIYSMVGAFTAMAYISPFFGGFIADYWLGHKRAVLWGAAVLALSYFSIVLVHNIDGIILALGGITIGTGLLKPNISSLLAHEYHTKTPEGSRDGAFTLFYVGISCGIILGTTVPTLLKDWLGWNAPFIGATIGLILAYITFWWGCRYYEVHHQPDYTHCTIADYLKSLLGIVAYIGIAYLIIHNVMIADIAFAIIAALSVIVVLAVAFKEEKHQRHRTIVFLLLCIISVMFWGLYFQMFLSLTLFIYRTVQPTIFGIEFPPPFYVTAESIGLVVFGPILAWLWTRLRQRNKRITTPMKFFYAMLVMTLSYGLILYATYQVDPNVRLSPWLIILAYLLISISELLLSPVGLSVTTKLVRKEVVGMMVGVFFVSLGIGSKLANMLSDVAAIPKHLDQFSKVEHIYQHAFWFYFESAIAATVISFILVLVIKRLMRANTLEHF